MNEKENNSSNKIYFIEVNGSKVYFKQHDKGNQVVSRGGKSVKISEHKFNDFLHMAKLLGFNAGEL